MSTSFDVRLDEYRAVTKGGFGLARCAVDGRCDIEVLTHDPHSSAATSRCRLDEHGHRETGWCSAGNDPSERRCWNARLDRRGLRCNLVAEQSDLGRFRPNPRQPCAEHLLGKLRTLGQKAIAGMYGICALRLRRGNHRIGAEV